MDDSQFWKIINHATDDADGDPEAVAQCIEAQLIALAPSEIQAFDAIFRSKLAAAYTWKLWGAAYLINGGCSDDGFEYFRGWLISRGQQIYDAAMADPDDLVDIVDPNDDNLECEDILYVAMSAYEQVTGNELPLRVEAQIAEPTGQNWDFDDLEATAQQLPRLAGRYLN